MADRRVPAVAQGPFMGVDDGAHDGVGDGWNQEFAAALHDSIIQRLLVVGVGLDSLSGSDAPGGAAAQMVRSHSILNEVIDELRSWILVLSTWGDESARGDGLIGVDLTRAVGGVIDEMILMLGFVPSFRCQAGLTIAQDLAGDVVAVVREGLSNIARHAGATAAVVWITQSHRRIKVHISDNGRWCDHRSGSGCGVSGMRRRAHRHGGSLAVSAGAFGTDLLWCAPLPELTAGVGATGAGHPACTGMGLIAADCTPPVD